MSGGHEKPAPRRPSVPLLVAVLLLAGFLGSRGIDFGLPFFYHWDEPALVQIGARMVQEGDFNPSWFHYPTLPGYLQGAAYAAAYLHEMRSSREVVPIREFPLETFYVWGRWATLLAGVATVAAVFLLARRVMSSDVAGLAAALVLALTPGFVEECRYITPNVPSALLAVVAVLTVASSHRWGAVVASGLLTGLAVGCKYNLLVLAGPVAVWIALVSRRSGDLPGTIGGKLAMYTACLGVGFLASTPYALIELPTFLDDLGFELHHYAQAGHAGAEGTNNLVYYLRYLARQGLGPVLSLLTLAGVAVALVRRRPRPVSPVLLFPVVYLAALSTLKVNFTRNLVPLYPFLAILAGVAVGGAIRWLRSSRRFPRAASAAGALVLVLALLQPLGRVWAQGSFLQRPDTRTLAREWVLKHVPAGSRLYLETARERPHPYGGFTKAPPIPADLYDLVPVRDLCVAMEPGDVAAGAWVVLCQGRAEYRARYGAEGEARFLKWVRALEQRRAFLRGPEVQGPPVRALEAPVGRRPGDVTANDAERRAW